MKRFVETSPKFIKGKKDKRKEGRWRRGGRGGGREEVKKGGEGEK